MFNILAGPAGPTLPFTAYKEYGTLSSSLLPRVIKLLPPSGSASTFINLLPVLQSTAVKEPVVLVAPAAPMGAVNKPSWLVVSSLVSV